VYALVPDKYSALLSEYEKKAEVFHKKADTSAMIGKRSETPPMIAAVAEARWCGCLPLAAKS
jgi:hypothetical protein